MGIIHDYIRAKGLFKDGAKHHISPYNPSEKTPSFTITKDGLGFTCWSTGEKGNYIKLIQDIENVTEKRDVFNILRNLNIVTESKREENQMQQQPKRLRFLNIEKGVKDIKLKTYLNSRGIEDKYHNVLDTIHWQDTKYYRKYVSVGKTNISGGVVCRNGMDNFGKINIGKSNITNINNNSKTLCIVEGILDYASVVQYLSKANKDLPSFIILNSTTNINKITKEELVDFSVFDKVVLCLDNGTAGDIATIKLENYLAKKSVKNVFDFRKNFKNYEDFNDFILDKKPTKRQYRVVRVDDCFNIFYKGEFVAVKEHIEDIEKFLRDLKKKQ
jgi:hypothetical protein